MTPTPSPAETDPRIYFAAERTLLAWIRTGLALMGFGFVVARFALFLPELAAAPAAAAGPTTPPHRWSLEIGTVLVALGVIVNLLAAVQHARTVRRLRCGEPYIPPLVSPGTILALALALIGLVMGAYLLSLSL
jgi:putative membrane protein